MKTIRYLLTSLCLLLIVSAIAQGDVNLRLDSNFIGLPATVHLNEVDSLTIMINNDSASAFGGKISIGYSINGNIGIADSASLPFFYPYNTDTIEPHSMIVRTLVVHVIAPFIIGSSGVVIWPIVTNSSNPYILISDSINVNVTVLPAVGIDEIAERELLVYMSGQQLIFKENGVYELKDVKLYDVAGSLLQTQQVTTSGKMNMNGYAIGVYFAQITFADDTRVLVKVVNVR